MPRTPPPSPDAHPPVARPRPWPLEPLPVSVWPCSPLRSCPNPGHDVGFGEPPCPWRWPADMWTAVIGNFARPGDRVLISDAGPVIPAVRAALDRGCSIVARAPSRIQRVGARIDLREGTARRQRSTVVLFGGRRGREANPTSSPRSSRQAPVIWPARVRRTPADLMVIPPPCPDETRLPWPRVRGVDPVVHWQQELVRDSLALVRPGGVVAVLTRNTPNTAGMVDRLRPMITVGQRLGLTYLQHNVLVHATLTRDRLIPAPGADDRSRSVDLTTPAGYATWMRLGIDRRPTPDPLTTPPPEPLPGDLGPVGDPLLHMPVHTDLVVFTMPHTAAAAAAVAGLPALPGLELVAKVEGAAA
jgi:hypothetical protein